MPQNDHSHCQDLLGEMSTYLDGNLNRELCDKLEKHLAECKDCRIVVDTMRKTIFLYKKTAAETGGVPDMVRERLYRSLNLDDLHTRM